MILDFDKVARAKRECGEVVDGFSVARTKHAKHGYDMACLVEKQNEAMKVLQRKVAALELMRAGTPKSDPATKQFFDGIWS